MSYSFTVSTSNDWSYLVTTSNDWSYTVEEVLPISDGLKTKGGGYILTKAGTKILTKQ